MGKITFIEHDGTAHTTAIEVGKSLMQIAVEQGIPGIDADCGGACACGTCHVFVSEFWLKKLDHPQADEIDMLGMSLEKKDNSRLSCQIQLSEDLDGLTVHLPEFQM